MITSKNIIRLVIVGFVVIGGGKFWFYYPNSIESKAQSQSALTLEISSSQKEFVQLEPISVKLDLSNQTLAPIKWSGFLGLAQNVNLLSRSETGAEFQWIGEKNVLEFIVTGTEVIQPGKDKQEYILLRDYLTEKLFPLPGRYKLLVEFDYLNSPDNQRHSSKIISNALIIEIKKPSGVNLRAYEYLKSNYELLVINGGEIKETIRAEQFFADNFGDSVYWKYVTFDLASRYMWMKEYEKAEQQFYNISDLNFYHSETIDERLMELAGKLPDRPNARTKRRLIPVNPPIAVPISPVPTVSPVPFPPDPPVLIPNPNPNPNPTP